MMYGQQSILTPQDERHMAEFLAAFVKKFSDYTTQILNSMTDIMKLAVVTYINEPIELTQGIYFTVYMVCDSRTLTIKPDIMMGVSKQDIDSKIMSRYANDMAVYLIPVSITELDTTRQHFKELASMELGTTTLFAPFMRDANYVYNIIKFIFNFEYAALTAIIMQYTANGMNNSNAAVMTDKKHFYNNRLFHNLCRYEFKTGPVFNVKNTTGIIEFTMEFKEEVNRAAKNDAAFQLFFFRRGMLPMQFGM